MSSYLTFYIIPKEGDNKPISLLGFSRNSEVYQYFNDNINPVYIGMKEETPYTELTIDKVNLVIEDLNNDINKAKRRLEEYEKHAAGNEEIIENIISQKEYIEDLQWALSITELIKEFVEEATYSWSSYSKVLCNID